MGRAVEWTRSEIALSTILASYSRSAFDLMMIGTVCAGLAFFV